MADIRKFATMIRLPKFASDPAGAEDGVLYYNTATNSIRQYLNGAFSDLPTSALTLLGLALDEGSILYGNASDLSAQADTLAQGDISASATGLNIKSGVIVDADINGSAAITLSKLAALTASRALVSDGSGVISVSAVTSTELGYVSGVTSAIQTQLNAKAAAADVADLVTLSGVPVNSTDLGTFTGTTIPDNSDNKEALQALETAVEAAQSDANDANTSIGHLVTLSGVAANSDDLGSFTGTIIPDNSDVKEALQSLETFVEAIPSPFYYAGVWAASTNTPTLDNTDTGVSGAVYYVTDSGTVDFGAGNISFEAGDKVANNGTTWDKWDMTDSVVSVNGQNGVVVLDTGDISEGSNLYFTDERAQDAVGTILVDTASVDLVYNDGTPSITATVLPAGVDHNALQNYVANEHVDHTSVQIATAADSGLTGGGTIAATRNLSVDIAGTTAETVADNADLLLIYDDSATALKSMSRANFLSGIAINSAGDINEGSFSGLADNTADQVITGLAFANGTVRSFDAIVSIYVDATADLYAQYILNGIQKASSWSMTQEYVGDDVPSLSFNITSAGQIRATIGSVTGFSSASIHFRATTTSV